MARQLINNAALSQTGTVVQTMPYATITVTDDAAAAATLYAAATGSTEVGTGGVTTADAKGNFSFYLDEASTYYTISVSLASTSYSYRIYISTRDVSVLGAARSYLSVALLAAAIAGGQTFSDGETVTAGTREFIAESGYVATRSALNGLRPKTVRVAVIGDSLSLFAPGRSQPWPHVLEDNINRAGVPVEFHNYAVGGASFATALTTFWREPWNGVVVDPDNPDAHEEYTKNQATKVADQDYDLVLVCLGYNNAFTSSENNATAQGHIDTFITAIKAATDAPVNFIRQYAWDRRVVDPSGSVTAIPNRLAIQQIHDPLPSGTPTGATGSNRYSNRTEYFDRDIGATARAKCVVLQEGINDYLVTQAGSDSQLFTVGELDLFTVNRMGLHTDGLHVDELGHKLLAANLIGSILDEWPTLFNAARMSKQNSNELYSMDDVFDAVINGVDYSDSGSNFYDVSRVVGGFGRDYIASDINSHTMFPYHDFDWTQGLNNWHLPLFRNMRVALPTSVLNAAKPITFTVTGAPAVSTWGIWNQNTSQFQTTRLTNYDGTAADYNRNGNLTYTTSLVELLSGSPPDAGTVDIGIRLQEVSLAEGVDYIEWWGKLEVQEDWVAYRRPIVTVGGSETGVVYAGVSELSGITQASPAVVTTSSAHGYSTSDDILLTDVPGMTEVSEKIHTINVLTSTTFELTGVDSTNYTAYAGGGTPGYSSDSQNRTAYTLSGGQCTLATRTTLTTKPSGTGDVIVDPDGPNKLAFSPAIGAPIASVVGVLTKPEAAQYNNNGFTLFKASGADVNAVMQETDIDNDFSVTIAADFAAAG